jgi:hypothetical protein
MTLNNSLIDKNELVFYSEKGNIQSGGYTINNILMNNNIPVMTTNNNKKTKNDNTVGSIFKDLAIPAGLLILQQPNEIKYPTGGNGNVIEDTLYNRLLKLASDDEKSNTTRKKHKTKRQKQTKQRKTKKYSIN